VLAEKSRHSLRPGIRLLSLLFFLTLVASPTYPDESTDISNKLLTKIAKEHGQLAKVRVTAWQHLIAQNQTKDVLTKLKLVNDFFNQLAYHPDQAYIGVPDYWQTPLEFLIAGGGECKDFSIAKYFTLKALQIPINKLHITYVKALNYNRAHMVLAYYPTPDADPLILDNLISDIKPGSQRTDLLPVYSFNSEGLWIAKLRGEGQYVSDSTNIGPWQDVQKRMQRERHGTTP
jgi:predicted transglutaminase-like cysteine proteinase